MWSLYTITFYAIQSRVNLIRLLTSVLLSYVLYSIFNSKHLEIAFQVSMYQRAAVIFPSVIYCSHIETINLSRARTVVKLNSITNSFCTHNIKC